MNPRSTSRTATILGALLLCWGLAAPVTTQIPKAQDAEIEALLQKLQKRFDNAEAASCRFRQSKQVSQLEGKIQVEGELLFQKPHYLRMTLTGDENMEVYSNGESVWIVDHDLDEVTELAFDTGATLNRLLPPSFFVEPADLRRRFRIHRAGTDDGLKLLEMLPVNAELSPFRSLLLGLDARNRLRRSRIEYANGDWVETAYRDWKALPRISSFAFAFRGQQDRQQE